MADLDDRSNEEFLIGAGLLPSASNDYVAMSPGRIGPAVSVLEPHYERVMRALAGEVADLRIELEIHQDRRYELQRQAGRLLTAVRWLHDVHEFDDLALRVIAYVLDEDD